MKSITQVFQNLLKPYIDRKDRATQANIAPVETDATSASQAYAEGAQLILNDVLYDVTAAITQGDALVVNTNIAAADDITTQIKNHTVTTDPVPTQNSTNPVQSGGVYTADANEAATRSAMGAKNLIPYPYYNGDSRDTNGILFTVNSDGSITISGEATADAYFRLTYTTGDIHIQLVSGKSYILSASGKADVAILLRDDSSSNVAVARGADATFDCTTSGNFDVIILVENGAVYTTPVTVYPMLRLATDANGDYHPYAKTNKELTDEVSSVKSAFTNNVNQNGCKNLFVLDVASLVAYPTNDGSWSGNTYTKNGVRCTINDDNIVFSGTPTNNGGIHILLKGIPKASYMLSGLAECTNVVWGNVILKKNDTQVTNISHFNKADWNLDLSSYDYDSVDIEIKRDQNNVAISGTLYPMLSLKTDYDLDSTWVAPSKNNNQLTEDSVTWDDISEVGAVNYLDSDASTTVDSSSGLTFTVNSGKAVTVSATSGTYPFTLSANANFVIKLRPVFSKLPLKLSGCPSGGSNDTFRIRYSNYVNDDNAVNDTGEGAIISTQINNTTYANAGIRINIKNGTTLTGPITFKPMLTDPSYNGPYVPYAKTNKKLTDDVESITKQSGGLISYGFANWSNDGATIELPRLGGLLVGGRLNKGFAIYICENGNELAVLAGSDLVSASISNKTLSLTFTSHYGSTFNYKYINSLVGLV